MADKGAKQDLRVTRTHRALVGALFQLLEKQSFQKITVNELCEAAMVSRATFYMHFEDKYHLLRFALEQTRIQIMANSGGKTKEEIIILAVEQTQRHAKVFRNLLLEDGSQELLQMFNAMFVEGFTAELKKMEEFGKKFPLPVEMIAVFVAGGLSNLLIWWISGNFTVSKEEIVKSLISLARREKDLEFPADFDPKELPFMQEMPGTQGMPLLSGFEPKEQ